MKFTIYYDAFQEAKWFEGLNKKFKGSELIPINQVDDTNKEIFRLLRYDKPDIILAMDNKAVLVLEKTTEVPTGHNIGQRFGRMVCAAEEGVVGIYFGPYVAMKHGKYANPCWINVRQLEAMLKLHKFHKIPSLAVDWRCDEKFELIKDGSETELLSRVISEFIESGFDRETKIIEKIEDEMLMEIHRSTIRFKNYASPPPSAKVRETDTYKTDSRLVNFNFSKEFNGRQQSIHYILGMKAGLRSDPFTGMQLIYDYLYCRTGPTKHDRYRNLVIEIPDLSSNDWDAVENLERKDKKMLSIFPDLLLLKNGYVKLH